MRYYVYKIIFENGYSYIGSHVEKKENDGYITYSSYYRTKKPKIIERKIICECKDCYTMGLIESIAIMDDKCENKKNVNGNYGNWRYNFCGFYGKHSEETRKKIRQTFSNMDSFKKEEWKKKISEKNKGRIVSEKTKKLHREFWKNLSKEQISKMCEKGLLKRRESGKIHPTKEIRKRISNTLKQYYKNHPEVLKNRKPLSDETRKKIAESLKGKPVWNKGKKMTEEWKKEHPTVGKRENFKQSEKSKLLIKKNSPKAIKIINKTTDKIYLSIREAFSEDIILKNYNRPRNKNELFKLIENLKKFSYLYEIINK